MAASAAMRRSGMPTAARCGSGPPYPLAPAAVMALKMVVLPQDARPTSPHLSAVSGSFQRSGEAA